MKHIVAFASFFLLSVVAGVVQAGVPHYRLTNLGVLPGYQASYATCLNDQGDVAGCLVSHQQQNSSRKRGSCAFLWKPGGMALLPSDPSQDAVASGINNHGQVVGTLSDFFDGAWMGTDLQTVIWDRNTITEIPKLLVTNTPFNQNIAVGINDAGEVACTADDDYFTDNDGKPAPHIFLYKNGKDKDLGAGCATGLTQSGQITAYVPLNDKGAAVSDNYMQRPAAVLCDAAGNRILLGNGYALNVSDSANVIGTNDTIATSGPRNQLRTELTATLKDPLIARSTMLLWRTGHGRSRAVTLPFHWLPQAINDRGWIVGSHFLWAQGQQYDLNQLVGRVKGWKIVCATAINKRNDIAGWGYRYGQPRAFLLTPRDEFGKP